MTIPTKLRIKEESPVYLFLLFALGLVLYLPAQQFEFVNWDDYLYVRDNPLINTLSWNRIARIFSTYQVANYHPITMLAYSLQYAVFGRNPHGYHFISLLLHALNGVLALRFLLALKVPRWTSILTSVLFVLHPLHAESVAWISSQKTLLSTALTLLTLILYSRFAAEKTRSHYALSLLFYALAVFAKPTAVAVPIILLALHGRLGPEPRPKMGLSCLPFTVLAVIQSGLVLLGHMKENAIAPLYGANLISHSLIPLWSVFTYLKKLLLPVDLLPLYAPLKEVRWGNLEFMLPALISLAAVLAILLLRRRHPNLAFLSFFFMISLAPTLNVVPLSVAIADRYLYLPSLGPLAIVAIGVVRLSETLRSRVTRVLLMAVILTIFLALFNMTRLQMKYWHDSRTLWTMVLGRVPDHALAHVKLGEDFYERGDLDRAISLVSKGMDLGLSNPLFAKNLVAMYIDKGNLNRACDSALSYARKFPSDGRFWIQLGVIESQRAPEKADSYFRKATVLNPGNPAAWYEWGRFCLERRSDVETAYRHFLKSVDLDPYNSSYHIAIADCLARNGDLGRAILALRYVLTLIPDSVEVWFNLSNLLKLQGNEEAGRQAMDRAIQLDPVTVTHLKQKADKKAVHPS